jgi:hypothetical protein
MNNFPITNYNARLSQIQKRLLFRPLSSTYSLPNSAMTSPPGEKGDGFPHNTNTSSSDKPEDAWKYRAPYRIHSPADKFISRYTAQCHCGRVQYQLSREVPLDAKYCHCTTCQRLHGAPFQWAAIFQKDDINFTNGHHDLAWYDSGEKTIRHKLPCKVSCAYCRTPIMDEGRNMILLFPTLINFKTKEERDLFAPR